MSTSNKLTYLNETKQELKQKINNLGGSIDEQTTFRQYAEELQYIYDNLPKTEYQEGTEINLGVTSKGKLDFENGVVGIGDTKQNSTNGYQLLGIPNYTETKNGVTVTILNGEITMSGTLINNATNFDIPIADIILNTTDTYSVAMNDNTTLPNGLGRYFLDSSLNLIRWSYGISGLQNNTGFSPVNNTTAKYLRLALNTVNVNYTGFKCKIMFERGATSHDFEQYSGGYASPSPNWEQPIQCVTGNQEIVESDGNNNSITYPISLGNNKFYNIGDYADELLYDVVNDKVYKKEVIRQITLNGTENWQRSGGTTEQVYVGVISISGAVDHKGLSNYFKQSNYTEENTFDVYNSGANLALRFPTSQITDYSEIKTWLQSHNTDVFLVRTTSQLTELTDTTLKQQVKNWYYAHSNNGTTIIESNGDLPMIIKVRALKGE